MQIFYVDEEATLLLINSCSYAIPKVTEPVELGGIVSYLSVKHNRVSVEDRGPIIDTIDTGATAAYPYLSTYTTDQVIRFNRGLANVSLGLIKELGYNQAGTYDVPIFEAGGVI